MIVPETHGAFLKRSVNEMSVTQDVLPRPAAQSILLLIEVLIKKAVPFSVLALKILLEFTRERRFISTMEIIQCTQAICRTAYCAAIILENFIMERRKKSANPVKIGSQSISTSPSEGTGFL